MTAEERKDLKNKIEETIQETEKKIKGLEEAAKPVAPENSIGRVSRMDAINNKSVAEAALRTARARLNKLNVALTKVDNEDFGNCAFCKRPIQPARLMFMPGSSRCVRCAER